MVADQVLTPTELAFLAASRTAVLATIDGDRRPRLVPICFAAAGTEAEVRIYSAVDEKPKKSDDPLALGRVRDILAQPHVWLLVDRWSEDWSELAWLRLEGRAELLTADVAKVQGEHAAAVAALRAKYPAYASHHLERLPIIRITVESGRSWGTLERRRRPRSRLTRD